MRELTKAGLVYSCRFRWGAQAAKALTVAADHPLLAAADNLDCSVAMARRVSA
jgi:hypothetical protein